MSERPEFSWGSLGEQWWRAAAEACDHKPTEEQLRFAVCRHDGLTAADSAARAGYVGEGQRIRQAGSRAAQSTSVKELLAYVFAETGVGDGDEGVVKSGEAKRILSRIARKGDNNARIKSLEALAKLDRDELAARSRDDGPSDPIESTRQLLVAGGIFSAPLVTEMWFNSAGDVTLAPHFEVLGPFVARRCPELWSKYRAPLLKRAEHFRGDEREQRYLEAFDAIGAAPEPTDEQFRAAIGPVVLPRSNGAAKDELSNLTDSSVPEQPEPTGDIENAA
jgi:hypothetical protein